jgi:GTP-binding protein Era
MSTRSGFVALAGRPNAGKSTLVNAIVGSKVAIVSDKPQTTRRAIRGVATRGDVQLVVVDLPGVQRPRDELTRRMQSRVEVELENSDAALLMLNGEQGVGPGDRFIAGLLAGSPVPVAVAVNKVDRLRRPQVVEALLAAEQLVPGAEIFPISARTGDGVEALARHLETLMPESPFLRRTFQEVPHAVEVQIEELERPREDLTLVKARVWVETESQKGILIGSGGQMIRAVGTAARRELQRELGTRVHLDLSVRVRRGWRADERLLDRLGIE